MQSLRRSFHSISHVACSNITQFRSSKVRLECESRTVMNFLQLSTGYSKNHPYELPDKNHSCNFPMSDNTMHIHRELTPSHNMIFPFSFVGANSPFRCITTVGHPEGSFEQDSSSTSSKPDQPQRIKFKRLSKTAKHIMNILDKEAVEKVQAHREIPDIRPGYIIQLKVEVPENKRRISTIKGIVIARRNAGLNTTFRLRRLVAGVGVESVFPLYSPNIKEMKVLDKKKVRRAKLYYLRNRMNPLKK